MNKLKNYRINHKESIYVCLINILLPFMLLLLQYPVYQYNMDIVMQTLVYNLEGTCSISHILFSNLVYGKLLEVLFNISNKLPWYVIVQYIINYISLCIIGINYIKTNKSKIAYFILTILTLFIANEVYAKPSYMKTSAILCTAGMFWMWCNLYSIKGESLKSNLFIQICIIVSGLISWRVFLCIFTTYSIIMIIYILLCKKHSNIKYVGCMLVICFCVSGLFRILDIYSYGRLPEWRNAAKYRVAIEKIQMYGVPDYEDMNNNIDLSYDEYMSIVSCNVDNKELFSLDNVQKLSRVTRDVEIKTFVGFMRMVPLDIFKCMFFYIIIILTGINCIYGSKNNKNCIWATWAVMMIQLLVSYHFYSETSKVLLFIIQMPISLILLYELKCTDDKHSKELVLFTSIILIFVCKNFSGDMVRNVSDDNIEVKFDTICSQQEQTYYININDILKTYSAYTVYPEGILQKYNIRALDIQYKLVPFYSG